MTAIPESADKAVIIDALYQNVIHWMDRDEKLTALKQLQGHIWRKAYQRGLIKSQYGLVYRFYIKTDNRFETEGS